MRVATFRLERHEADAVALLADLGFVFGPTQTTTTTLLDTFDGRLHRAGVRLEAMETDLVELELTGNATAPAHLPVPVAPRVAADLGPGPFRSRIAAMTDVRALLPQIRVRSDRTRGTWRDGTDKVVAIVDLHEGVSVVDHPHVGCIEATIEVYQLPGYPKQSRRTLEALRGAGVAECETDTLMQCAAAVGVDPAGFSSGATAPLDPGMVAIDGFRRVLATLATAIEANWQGTIDQLDPEFLHDLRIAVRRTRTILAEAKTVLPPAILEPARQDFAWLAGLTGPPRDLDVYLLEWARYTDPLGIDVARSLGPVRDLLERRRVDAHVELERGLRSERALELIGEWQTWLSEPYGNIELPSRADRAIGRVVAGRITRAHDVLIERGRLITPETPAEQVHDLRKDAKKLRYLLECFGSLLPKGPRRRYVRRLKALQDNLGEHQDADVHVTMLRAIARELPDASPDTMVAIGRLTERLDQQRLAARAEFAERFAEYDMPTTTRALDAMLDGINE